MTLVDTFVHILDGYDFNNEEVDSLLKKVEDKFYDVVKFILNK